MYAKIYKLNYQYVLMKYGKNVDTELTLARKYARKGYVDNTLKHLSRAEESAAENGLDIAPDVGRVRDQVFKEYVKKELGSARRKAGKGYVQPTETILQEVGDVLDINDAPQDIRDQFSNSSTEVTSLAKENAIKRLRKRAEYHRGAHNFNALAEAEWELRELETELTD